MSLTHKQALWALFAVSLQIFIINIDYSGVNLALIAMSQDVNCDLNTIQWMLSAYVLAWGSVVVLAGKLADLFGKKLLLTIGVSIFAAASLIIGMGESAHVLIGGRILQGIGGALFIPSLYAITFAAFPPERHGFAIGVIGGAAGIGLACGPSLSGFLLEFLSWRWIFWINIPLALTTIGIIHFNTPRDVKPEGKHSLDMVGAILLSGALPSLIYGLHALSNRGLDSHAMIYLMIGFVLTAGFISHLGKVEEPLISPGLISNPTYFKGCLIPFMSHQFSFSVVLVTSGLYLQNILHFTAFDAGFVFLAMTAAFGVLSIYGGQISDKWGLRVPSIMGLGALTLGLVMSTLLTAETSLAYVLASLLIIGFGLGFCFSSFNAGMMKAVPSSDVTLASSVFAMACLIGHTTAVVGTSLMITFFGQWKAQSLLASSSLDAAQIKQLGVIMSSTHRAPELFAVFEGIDLNLIYKATEEGFLFASHLSLGFAAALCGVGTLLAHRYLHISQEALEDKVTIPSIAA